MIQSRLSRCDYGLALVEVIKLRAACTRRQVGAVILDADGRIVSTGYNGTAKGQVHCPDGGCPRGAFGYEQVPPLLGNDGHEVACVALHAERNAITWALQHSADLKNCTLYISCEPCPDCRRLAKGVALGAVIWSNGQLP